MNRNVISRWKRDKHPTAQPLSNRAIVLGAVIVLRIGAAAFTVLLRRYGGADPGVELDAVRTAGALMVAAGGAATLLLAARRQQSTEQTLEHERENAAEQRITELYTRAVDQLGAEKAPVRLGGLHALERLAQNNPTQRQTIIDVICSYLRMPFTPPPDRPYVHSGGYRSPGPRRRRHRALTDPPPASPTPTLRYQQAREEGQVRLTAQRILAAHLKPEAEAAYWANIDLDLTEAHLHQLDLSNCHVRRAQFGGATFIGRAAFDGAMFAGNAVFNGAEFAGNAVFIAATFIGQMYFRGATFAKVATFGGATFEYSAIFDGATFIGTAEFYATTFVGRPTIFDEAEFVGRIVLDRARVAPSRDVVLPTGWTTRPAAEGEEEGWLYVVRDEDSSEQPAEAPGDGPA